MYTKSVPSFVIVIVFLHRDNSDCYIIWWHCKRTQICLWIKIFHRISQVTQFFRQSDSFAFREERKPEKFLFTDANMWRRRYVKPCNALCNCQATLNGYHIISKSVTWNFSWNILICYAKLSDIWYFLSQVIWGQTEPPTAGNIVNENKICES